MTIEEFLSLTHGAKAEMWAQCERGDLMLGACSQMAGRAGWPSREQVILAACAVAEQSLSPSDSEYLAALDATRLFAAGKLSKAEWEAQLARFPLFFSHAVLSACSTASDLRNACGAAFWLHDSCTRYRTRREALDQAAQVVRSILKPTFIQNET